MSAAATALRVFLYARNQTSLAFGLGLIDLWNRSDPAACLVAEVSTLEQRVFAAGESTRILWLRLEQMPPHERPRYSRRAALAILRFQDQYRLPCAEVALLFLLDRSTIHRWRRRRERLGERLAFAPAPKPVPPCRRIDDPTRQIVRDAHEAGFESRLLAATLTRAGYKVGRTSVCRFCAEPADVPSTPRPFSPVMSAAREVSPAEEMDPLPCAEPLRLPPRVTRAFTALRHAVGHALIHVLRSFRGAGMAHARERRDALLREERRLLTRRSLLRSRLAGLPPHQRPRYRPDLRVAILAFKHRLRLPNDELARISSSIRARSPTGTGPPTKAPGARRSCARSLRSRAPKRPLSASSRLCHASRELAATSSSLLCAACASACRSAAECPRRPTVRPRAPA